MNGLKEQITKSKDTRCDWCSPKGPMYLDIDPDRVGPRGSLHWHHRESGSLHRDRAPAILGADGSKHWYQQGKLHRNDGPALEQRNAEHWYQHGKLHREDGPAIEHANGTRKWYLNGQRLDFDEWLQQVTDSDKTRFQLALRWAGLAQNTT
jgi:hypothetical protein